MLGAAVGIMELPVEIIVEILDLAWKHDRGSFEILAATCKEIRNVSRDGRFASCFRCGRCETELLALRKNHLTCAEWCRKRSITRLPEEIILQILKFSWENDKASFENMAATSKKIRRISRDDLFKGCFKCRRCHRLKDALVNDHLTCYKWHYDKIAHPDNDLECIRASKAGSLKVVKFLARSGAYNYASCDPAVRCAAENGHLEIVKYLVSLGTMFASLRSATSLHVPLQH